MVEARVQLHCRACEKEWQETARSLPEPGFEFTCPDCGVTRSLSEFLLTQRDLQTLKNLHEGGT